MLKKLRLAGCITTLFLALLAPVAAAEAVTSVWEDAFYNLSGTENASYQNIEVTQLGYNNTYDKDFFDKTYIVTAAKGRRASITYAFDKVHYVDMKVYGANSSGITQSSFLSYISATAGTKQISNVQYNEDKTVLSATVRIANINKNTVTITFSDNVKIITNHVKNTSGYNLDVQEPDEKSSSKKSATKKKSTRKSSSSSRSYSGSSGGSSSSSSSSSKDKSGGQEVVQEGAVGVNTKTDNRAVLYIGVLFGLLLAAYIIKLLFDFLKKKKDDDDKEEQVAAAAVVDEDSEAEAQAEEQAETDFDRFKQKQLERQKSREKDTKVNGKDSAECSETVDDK